MQVTSLSIERLAEFPHLFDSLSACVEKELDSKYKEDKIQPGGGPPVDGESKETTLVNELNHDLRDVASIFRRRYEEVLGELSGDKASSFIDLKQKDLITPGGGRPGEDLHRFLVQFLRAVNPNEEANPDDVHDLLAQLLGKSSAKQRLSVVKSFATGNRKVNLPDQSTSSGSGFGGSSGSGGFKLDSLFAKANKEARQAAATTRNQENGTKKTSIISNHHDWQDAMKWFQPEKWAQEFDPLLKRLGLRQRREMDPEGFSLLENYPNDLKEIVIKKLMFGIGTGVRPEYAKKAARTLYRRCVLRYRVPFIDTLNMLDSLRPQASSLKLNLRSDTALYKGLDSCRLRSTYKRPEIRDLEARKKMAAEEKIKQDIELEWKQMNGSVPAAIFRAWQTYSLLSSYSLSEKPNLPSKGKSISEKFELSRFTSRVTIPSCAGMMELNLKKYKDSPSSDSGLTASGASKEDPKIRVRLLSLEPNLSLKESISSSTDESESETQTAWIPLDEVLLARLKIMGVYELHAPIPSESSSEEPGDSMSSSKSRP